MKQKKQSEFDTKVYKKIKGIVDQFGRVRIMFPDYPAKESYVWNGVYADVQAPDDYTKALYKLAAFAYALGKKDTN